MSNIKSLDSSHAAEAFVEVTDRLPGVGTPARWKVETGEFYGCVTELDTKTGQCRFEFDLEPWQHFAKIEDPALHQLGNPYVQAALTGGKICVVAEALVDDWHQYGWIRILRTSPDPRTAGKAVAGPLLTTPTSAPAHPTTPAPRF